MAERPPRIAVVLAGGVGSRFWPASTPERPKQLLPLNGSRSLIAETVERARSLVGIDNLRILTGPSLVEPTRREVPDLTRDHFLVEPQARSTGPVLAWAAMEIDRQAPGAVMISLHADHVIAPMEEFRDTLERATTAALEHGVLVCLGAVPDRAETGYGYVELGEPLGEGIHRAAHFHEKPPPEVASRYAASGRHLWNTGIFVWRVADFLAAVRRWTPEVAGALGRLAENDVDGFFASVDTISVDEGVLERADNVAVVRATFDWDDVGSWSALARTQTPDAAGNTVVGDVRAIDAHDNIAWSEEGSVVLFGVRDLVVVRSGSTTLVTTRAEATRMKQLLEKLEGEGAT